MGLCASSSSPSEAGGVIKRVLLLGPGGCGKSTVFKQAEMQLMGNEGGFTEDARRSWAVRMNSALLDLARILVHVATDNNPAALLDSPEAQTVLMQPADGTACPGTWEECLEVQGMVAATLKKSVQLMQEGERGKLESWISGLPDDAAVQFLLARHESFLRPDFTPDDSDILQFRYPTVATKVAKFTLPRRGKEASSGGGTGASIELTDVGGQRRERLKWKELGDRTDFVLFVASLDDYHRTLEEDATKNRLAEALTVFKMVVTKHMRGTPIILFLNKSDCFVESLAAGDRPISAFFPTYKGAEVRATDPPDDKLKADAVRDGIEYIRGKFSDIYDAAASKNEDDHLAVRVTCAVDRQQMKKVFMAMNEIILYQSLASSGFMVR